MTRSPLPLRPVKPEAWQPSSGLVALIVLGLVLAQFVTIYAVGLVQSETREHAAETQEHAAETELRLRNVQEQLIDLARTTQRIENRLP